MPRLLTMIRGNEILWLLRSKKGFRAATFGGFFLLCLLLLLIVQLMLGSSLLRAVLFEQRLQMFQNEGGKLWRLPAVDGNIEPVVGLHDFRQLLAALCR